MKKLFSFLLVLVMLLSLGTTAFAEGDDPPAAGTITITNATKNDTYSLYKIFNARHAVDDEGNTIYDADGNPVVAYSIDDENQFFSYMFGADGTAANTYFTYDANSGEVVRNANTKPADIIQYLTDMVRSAENSFTAEQTETAGSDTLAFSGLEYGYYLIDKGNGATVTIDTNTPYVEVIDKNQKPATSFNKLVRDEDQTDVSKQWVTTTSANIGDIVDFKVDFTATNYDGDKQIRYYKIKDTKGGALWVEFNSIKVTVNGESVGKGWYHCAGESGLNTGEWVAAKAPDQWAATPNEAGWYLIHYGYDDFEIVIPWMENHQFEGTTNGFTLNYAENAKSKNDSPVNVVIEYNASVEPNATIGVAENNNLWNTAELTWVSTTTHGGESRTTNINVYALGLEKIDSDTEDHLQGAVFEVYSDAECNDPVYVIPTNIKGVYILDDLTTFVTGANRETSRLKYAAYLEAYLGADYATTQKNVVTSEANGKLVILGLEAGDYYLVETKAPEGYNKTDSVTQVNIGQTSTNFFVIADSDGNVVDAQNAVDGYTMYNFNATRTEVENSKGVELPSTGGEGTMMLITFGAVITLLFAVLLITHKKMSVYHD